MIDNLNILEWDDYLTKSTANENEHPWICEVKRNGGPLQIEVLTKNQINRFFNDFSRWNSSCKKLPLDSIIKISHSQMCENHLFHFIIQKYIKKADVFSTKIENKLIKELEMNFAFIHFHASILASLNKMISNKNSKKNIEKTKSVWGKIKWFFLDLFFPTRKLQVDNFNISKKKIVQIFKISLEQRIIANMDTFENEIGQQRNILSFQESDLDFPKKIRKLWLTKFAEDKYRNPVSELADTSRKGIIGMLKIWSTLDKIGETQNITLQNEVNQNHLNCDPMLT